MKTPIPELVSAYLRTVTRAGPQSADEEDDDPDFWAFSEVSDRVRPSSDPGEAWDLVTTLVDAAEESLDIVAAGPLEEFVRCFGARAMDQIEARAAEDPKFKTALGWIWLDTDELTPELLERVVRASGGKIKPLERRKA